MHIPLQPLAQASVRQIRDSMRRMNMLHEPVSRSSEPRTFWGAIELPKPDAVAWEDTEIDVRRVVL